MNILSKKDQCKELMTKFFGPATAALVETMSENNCVGLCKQKVAAFLGEECSKEFDSVN